jgi:NADH:ubiquinone oxidoreductase subunit E
MTLEHKLIHRDKLLNILKKIQRKNGYLPEAEIRRLSKKINIPVTEIYSTATFYSLLNVNKKGRKIVKICNSPSCYLNGSLDILKEAKKILKIDAGQTTKNGKFSLELTSCIGCCDKAPAIMINEELITNVNKVKLRKLLK